MLEKDIENLIALYPHEFFPKNKFVLNGQQVKLGSCYADIMFTDEHDRKIIVEVKRGILSRDAAGQIMEYYGLLKHKEPDTIIELIACANTIPPERKLFLEKVGIECKELGLSLIQSIASKYNYKFLDAAEPHDIKIPPEIKKKDDKKEFNIDDYLVSIWIFQANPNRYDVLNALTDPDIQQYCWQVNQHKKDIKKGDIALIWMSGKEAGIYAIAEVASDPAIMSEPPAEQMYWMSNSDKGDRRLRVELVNQAVLINSPVFRSELKDITHLKNLSILKVAQGTNFPVSPDEWHIIKGLIDKSIRARN